MENQDRQTSDAAYWQIPGEDGVPQDLLMVRRALQDLPKVSCPVGFDMRLERRLAGNAPESRGRSTQRNWALGWTGVGLGLATALVIAVVAFDTNFSGSKGGVVSGGAAIPAPTAISLPAATTPPVAAPDLTSPATDKASTQQMAQEQTKRTVTGKDSTSPSPSSLPDGLIHAVSGNEK